jgi:hypothetical protein
MMAPAPLGGHHCPIPKGGERLQRERVEKRGRKEMASATMRRDTPDLNPV